MLRVPASAEEPTFGDTINISFRQWLTSSSADRNEWARRRNAASGAAAAGQRHQAAARYEQNRSQQRTTQTRPLPADRNERTLGRLLRVNLWLSSFALAGYLIAMVIFLAIAAAVIWLLLA